MGRRSFGRAVLLGAPAVVAGAALAGTVLSGTADAATGPTWSTTGNAGSSATTNFIGTTDANSFVVRTANVERVRFTKEGNVGIGLTSPLARLHVRNTVATGLFERTSATGSDVTLRATTASPDSVGVVGKNSAPINGANRGVAVAGFNGTGARARVHPSGGFWDGAGEFCGFNGVIGAASADVSDGYGVIGLADNKFGVGVYAQGTGGAKALVTSGNADIVGTLTKSGGSFRIDHPLDPANRYLSHSFVESPDMKNVYDGMVTADANGAATVALPAWFAALNSDYRYQLTAIGAAAPNLHVSTQFDGTSFAIAGAQPGMTVSWQLTGIRKDTWANAHRIPIESDKPAAERGRFLHPELQGADLTRQIGSKQVAGS